MFIDRIEVISGLSMTRLVGRAGFVAREQVLGIEPASRRHVAKNPKKRKRAKRQPTEADIVRFVGVVREAALAERVEFTDSAHDDLAALEMTEESARRELRNLEVDDFLKRVRSERNPDEDVWVFLAPIGRPFPGPAVEEEDRYWIRLVRRDQLVVISFHEA